MPCFAVFAVREPVPVVLTVTSPDALAPSHACSGSHHGACCLPVSDHITLYGDHADGALFYSETFNRTPALGKHPFQLYSVEPIDGAGDRAPSSAAPCSPGDLASTPPARSGSAATSGEDVAASPRSALHAGAAPNRPDLGRGTSRRIRGAPPPAPPGARNQPFDMDVIDVSWMDGNMHAMRHNFFNINRWMVDDLREILTTRVRARLRTSRMTHRFSNVWSFLAVPTFVVNP